jgi:hypothetical protein
VIAPQEKFYPSRDTEVWVLFDLRELHAEQRARREIAAWGPEYTRVHVLDPDHVAVEFLPGAAQRLFR